MKWEETKLSGLFEVKHGFAFKSEFFSESGKYAVTTPGHFYEAGGFRQREGKEKYYKGEFPPQYLLSKGDLIIAMTEQGEGLLGSTAIIPEDEKYLHNQRLGLVINEDKERIWKKFLYYLLNTYEHRATIASSATGTKVKHTSPKRILDLTVKLPPLPTQQKIASILSAYDDLIENNLKRIKLLEEAAQHLYREWFVKFRFPGWEAVRVVDGLPEGWERKTLGEVCILTMGQSPSSDFYNETGEGLPFHQGVTNYGDRFVSHKTYCTNQTRIAEEGDILCSVRAPVGRLNVTLDKIIIGRGLSAIRNKDNFQSFQFYQLKNHFVQEDMIGGGTIFSSVTKKELESQVFVCPSKELIEAFERICSPMDNQIQNLHVQNQRLKEGRDLLLPRLMGGVLEV
jgi:type I restriction enzyme S subunit